MYNLYTVFRNCLAGFLMLSVGVLPSLSAGPSDIPGAALAAAPSPSSKSPTLVTLDEASRTAFNRFKARTVRTVHVPEGEKVIALTFDDGPMPDSTARTLDDLRQYGAKATFYVTGDLSLKHPEVLLRIAKEGHEIGNHSWTHRYGNLSPLAILNEVDNTSALIEKLTGREVMTFRPPGAILTNGMAARAKQRGYPIVLWSVSSGDAAPNADSQSMVQAVLSNARPGGIVLLHDGGGKQASKAKAVPIILQKLTEQGYRFVTVSELLALAKDPKPLKKKKPPTVPRAFASKQATPKARR